MYELCNHAILNLALSSVQEQRVMPPQPSENYITAEQPHGRLFCLTESEAALLKGLQNIIPKCLLVVHEATGHWNQ